MPKLTYHGHDCFVLEHGGKRIAFDPFLTGNPKAARTADEVDADAILLTHGHGDHLGDTVAIAQRTDALVIANFEIVRTGLSTGRNGLAESAEKSCRPCSSRTAWRIAGKSSGCG